MHTTFAMKRHNFSLEVTEASGGKTLATWELWDTTSGTPQGSGVVSRSGSLVGRVRPVRARSLRATSSQVWGAANRAYQAMVAAVRLAGPDLGR